MDRPLVVTDPSDRAQELIREAGEVAASNGAPLRVLTVVSREEYENDAAVIESIGDVEDVAYSSNPAEYARSVASSAISDLLSDFDIETEAIGRSVEDGGERADAILRVANEADCDYIYLIGQRRRPTGKAVFGHGPARHSKFRPVHRYADRVTTVATPPDTRGATAPKPGIRRDASVEIL